MTKTKPYKPWESTYGKMQSKDFDNGFTVVTSKDIVLDGKKLFFEKKVDPLDLVVEWIKQNKLTKTKHDFPDWGVICISFKTVEQACYFKLMWVEYVIPPSEYTKHNNIKQK